jgi:hypothetical protein
VLAIAAPISLLFPLDRFRKTCSRREQILTQLFVKKAAGRGCSPDTVFVKSAGSYKTVYCAIPRAAEASAAPRDRTLARKWLQAAALSLA